MALIKSQQEDLITEINLNLTTVETVAALATILEAEVEDHQTADVLKVETQDLEEVHQQVAAEVEDTKPKINCICRL